MNKQIKKVAIAAVKKSGKMLLREYQNFDRGSIKLKSHHEILTKADLMSEEIIIREIKQNFPAHGILSEEMGRVESSSEYLWIIDPVDGTTNFSMHNPIWAISLAVAKTSPQPSPYKGEGESELILGIVFAPVLNELFITELGKGVTLNNRKITVSNISHDKAINTFCHGSKDRDIRKAIAYYRKQKIADLDCRQLGSASLELAYVASGRTESIMIPGANLWDVAAGVLLVNEAGGIVTDFKGGEWNLNSVDMLASNGKVHREVMRVINKK